jgi:hypothetical protein
MRAIFQVLAVIGTIILPGVHQFANAQGADIPCPDGIRVVRYKGNIVEFKGQDPKDPNLCVCLRNGVESKNILDFWWADAKFPGDDFGQIKAQILKAMSAVGAKGAWLQYRTTGGPKGSSVAMMSYILTRERDEQIFIAGKLYDTIKLHFKDERVKATFERTVWFDKQTHILLKSMGVIDGWTFEVTKIDIPHS